jgi:hypothetical protein
MSKGLVTSAAALAIVFAASLTSNRAEAGASASAPSKYSKASVVSSQVWTNWRNRRGTGPSEYSASSNSRKR